MGLVKRTQLSLRDEESGLKLRLAIEGEKGPRFVRFANQNMVIPRYLVLGIVLPGEEPARTELLDRLKQYGKAHMDELPEKQKPEDELTYIERKEDTIRAQGVFWITLSDTLMSHYEHGHVTAVCDELSEKAGIDIGHKTVERLEKKATQISGAHGPLLHKREL